MAFSAKQLAIITKIKAGFEALEILYDSDGDPDLLLYVEQITDDSGFEPVGFERLVLSDGLNDGARILLCERLVHTRKEDQQEILEAAEKYREQHT